MLFLTLLFVSMKRVLYHTWQKIFKTVKVKICLYIFITNWKIFVCEKLCNSTINNVWSDSESLMKIHNYNS